MDHWVFHTILLCIPLCLGLVQNQGNQMFEPRNLRIYSNNSVQRLLLEWDVSDYSEAYNSKIDIDFNIQIRLREENGIIILNVNYTTVLSQARQHHQWSFISELACGFSDVRDNDATYLYLTNQPDKPQNLNCETEDMIHIRCTWNPVFVSTDCFFRDACPMEFILSDVSSTKIYCSTKFQNSCSFKMGDQFLYNVRLTARNCLGQKHEQLSFNVMHTVRPVIFNKPAVDYQNATFIQLSWDINPINASLSLLCQINAANGDGNKQYNITVQSNSDFPPRFQLGGLKPATKYALKVRCAADVGPSWKWSSWTESIISETPETAPSGLLDVWRYINPDLEQHNVTVFWKESSEFRANGKIQKYHLSLENLEEPSMQHHNYSSSASQKSSMISLGNHSYKILVWAQNGVSASSPSVIIIPATNKNGKVHLSKETTDNNTEHGIYISWKPQSKFSQYVVDWCNHPTGNACDFQWKKYEQNKSSDLITSDAFRHGVRYTFNVYGIQDDKSYLLEKKVKYLKEEEPLQYILCNIVNTTANSLKVTWEPQDQKFNSCFIRGYVLYMKMDNQNCMVQGSEQFRNANNLTICSYKIEKPNQTEFTVRHLKPRTKYLFAVQAYAVKPHYTDNGTFKTVFTPDDGKWLFHLLYLLVIIPLMLMCMCSRKSNRVRNCLYPTIPQPKVTPIFKMSSGMTEVNDIIPDQLVMLEKPQEFSRKQSTLGMLLENLSYSQTTYYPEMQTEERTNQKFNSGLTSYKPLQAFGFTTSPNPCTPEAHLHSKDHLNYLYQMEVPPSMIQGTNSTCPVPWLDYRPQCSTISRRNTDY
ncbi:oncostatin-M-specific receptor subunit beta-like isoform X2 [Crotalus tigris]|uniref:oncostatin-M-specific receptor subunit beta-like isoform X2 n=1 Tax=Crotalus tigris TaxID=88082 RepID=UPI00192F9FAC|nr:oncostatin-M-specific receptor subunit beta-like isoform X2 [Crotalus tigris]